MLKRSRIIVSMNRLSRDKRTQILRCFTEGVGVNATARMADVSKNSVLKLLGDLGPVCESYQREHLRGLDCRRFQCDEVWAFCHAKAKNVPEGLQGRWGFGDVWTWTALDSESKMILAYEVGSRNAETAIEFLDDLRDRPDRIWNCRPADLGA